MVALVDFCLQLLVVVGPHGSCRSHKSCLVLSVEVGHVLGIGRHEAVMAWPAWMGLTVIVGLSRLIPWYACHDCCIVIIV